MTFSRMWRRVSRFNSSTCAILEIVCALRGGEVCPQGSLTVRGTPELIAIIPC